MEAVALVGAAVAVRRLLLVAAVRDWLRAATAHDWLRVDAVAAKHWTTLKVRS